jgi:ABC-type nitrate/sulfonate/bicarbonate transport system substrate-binding protein
MYFREEGASCRRCSSLTNGAFVRQGNDQPKGERVTGPQITRRTVWHSSFSLAAICAGGLASTCTREDDVVRYGTVIGTLGALRTVLPSIEKNCGLKYGKPVTIGVPTGSMQHAKLLLDMKSLGVDGEHDAQIVNIPLPNLPRALEAGEVDMAMTLCVFGAIAIDQGNAKLVRQLYGKAWGKQEIGFIVNRKLARDKPAFVQRIVSSLAQAMDTFVDNADLRIELEYSRLPDAVIAMQERQFVKYSYRTNVVDLKAMARELRDLGWVKEDYSDGVGKYNDLAFLAKATRQSAAQLSTW